MSSSKNILILALLAAMALASIGTVFYRSLMVDTSLKTAIMRDGRKLNYINPDNPEALQADVADNWAILRGKVDRESDKEQIGRVAAQVWGVRGVTNNIETLNTKALASLRELLAAREVPIDYVIKTHGTIVLSGPVTDEGLKQKIEDMVYSIRGVQKVENHLGQHVGALVEQKIRDILRLHNIYFDFNKWSIRDDSMMAIQAISGVLKEYPFIRVRIEGHTDSIDTEQYNQELSQKRAESVVNALKEQGIPADRMEAKGFGESTPIAPNSTPEGRAENRRIEFHVISEAVRSAERSK